MTDPNQIGETGAEPLIEPLHSAKPTLDPIIKLSSEPSAESCATCKFGRVEVHGEAPGFCVRYPQKMGVVASHWCGEWRAK